MGEIGRKLEELGGNGTKWAAGTNSSPKSTNLPPVKAVLTESGPGCKPALRSSGPVELPGSGLLCTFVNVSDPPPPILAGPV